MMMIIEHKVRDEQKKNLKKVEIATLFCVNDAFFFQPS